MKLKVSDAILLGSVQLKPVRGVFFDQNGGGCALGMAMLASGFEQTSSSWVDYAKMHPWLQQEVEYEERPCECPDCSATSYYGGGIATIFNVHVMGDQTWTLERLVDWVRSVEPSETINAVETGEVVAEKKEETVCV